MPANYFSHSRERRAEAALFGITFLWGGTFIIVKDALAMCSPGQFVALRFLVAFLVVVTVFGKRLRGITRQEVLQGLLLGFFHAVGFILQTIGLGMTTVSKSGFITGTLVILTPFAYFIVERRPIGLANLLGVVLAGSGLWLFTNPQWDNLNYGDVMTFGSAALWAFYITYVDVFTRDTKPEERLTKTARSMAMQIGVTLISALIFIPFEPVHTPIIWSIGLFGALFYTGILTSVVTTFVQMHFQSATTPVRAALIFALEPVIAWILGISFHGDIAGIREVIGASGMLLGIIVAEVGSFFFEKYRNKTISP